MKYEIYWNEHTYYITNAGNPIKACLDVLDEFLDTNPDIIPLCPFNVTSLDGDGASAIFGLAEVIGIRHLSANCDVPCFQP